MASTAKLCESTARRVREVLGYHVEYGAPAEESPGAPLRTSMIWGGARARGEAGARTVCQEVVVPVMGSIGTLRM